MRRFKVLIFWGFCCVAVWPSGARADNTSTRLSNTDPEVEGEPLYFVPTLAGEWTLGLGLDVRRTDELRGGATLPELGGALRLGYRRYLDDVGQVAVGGYGLATLDRSLSTRRGALTTLGGGLSAELRLMSPNFLYLLFGAWAEGGAAWWTAPEEAQPSGLLPPEALQTGAAGWRAAAGLEAGLGLMGWFDPWIYMELPIFVGVEQVELEGASWSTLIFGLQVRLGAAHR